MHRPDRKSSTILRLLIIFLLCKFLPKDQTPLKVNPRPAQTYVQVTWSKDTLGLIDLPSSYLFGVIIAMSN